MSRLNLDDVAVPSLEELIPKYASDKQTFDCLKKEVDLQNTQIKSAMLDAGKDEYTAGGYTAKRIVTRKESVDEAMLLEVVKKHNIPAIKVVEVVDSDELEAYLYNHEMSDELAEDIDRCRKVSEVVQLRIGKEKKHKEDE